MIFSFLDKINRFYRLKKARILFEAVENNQFEILKHLLEKGAIPNTQSQYWDWPLIIIAILFPKCLKILIQFGANVNCHETNKFYSPLIVAVRNKHPESLGISLNHKADTHWLSFAGFPALFYAAEFQQEDMVADLLKHENDFAVLEEVILLLQQRQINNP